MYNALVMPYFNYCGAVWGNVNKGLAHKLQKLQNRAARILTFSNCDVYSSVLLDELGWERLEYIRLIQLAVTMYKIHNDLSPSYLVAGLSCNHFFGVLGGLLQAEQDNN